MSKVKTQYGDLTEKQWKLVGLLPENMHRLIFYEACDLGYQVSVEFSRMDCLKE